MSLNGVVLFFGYDGFGWWRRQYTIRAALVDQRQPQGMAAGLESDLKEERSETRASSS